MQLNITKLAFFLLILMLLILVTVSGCSTTYKQPSYYSSKLVPLKLTPGYVYKVNALRCIDKSMECSKPRVEIKAFNKDYIRPSFLE